MRSCVKATRGGAVLDGGEHARIATGLGTHHPRLSHWFRALLSCMLDRDVDALVFMLVA